MRLLSMMRSRNTSKVLAKLEPGELVEILANEKVLDDLKHLHGLASRGQQAIWWGLRSKYKLPEHFDLDRTTGEVFSRNG